MKKTLSIIMVSLLICISFFGCAKPENRADTSLRAGEAAITGEVERVNGNILLIADGKGGRYSFCYSDEVEVVVDGWYVVDMSADAFKGERVTVICSEQIMETYPAQLMNERMIIVES